MSWMRRKYSEHNLMHSISIYNCIICMQVIFISYQHFSSSSCEFWCCKELNSTLILSFALEAPKLWSLCIHVLAYVLTGTDYITSFHHLLFCCSFLHQFLSVFRFSRFQYYLDCDCTFYLQLQILLFLSLWDFSSFLEFCLQFI